MKTKSQWDQASLSIRRQFAEMFPEQIFPLRRLLWKLGRQGRRNRRSLSDFRNRHSGERCFIIGNGPSLNRMDLKPLRGETAFSLNRGYLYYDRIGRPCDYLVAVNTLVLQQFAEEISALDNTKFLAWGCRRWYQPDDRILYLAGPTRAEPPRFSTDISRDLWAGATVTYVAMQLA